MAKVNPITGELPHGMFRFMGLPHLTKKFPRVGKALEAINKADISAGTRIAKRFPRLRRLMVEFTPKEIKQFGTLKRVVSKGQYRATAPLSKTLKFAVPMLAFGAAMDITSKIKKQKELRKQLEQREWMQE